MGAVADEFGVSRDTVQRAPQILSEENLIERFPGLGYFVSSP